MNGWSRPNAASRFRLDLAKAQDPMLYDPDRHEPLHPEEENGWDEARARACIAAIVRDTETQFSPQSDWPTHPLDAEPGGDAQAGNPSLWWDC